jgi:hypothetical protein
MEFKKGSRYIIQVDVKKVVLTYECIILEDSEMSIKIKDTRNQIFEFNKTYIISSMEVHK